MPTKQKVTLTFAIMDPPFESSRTATFFRLLQLALEAGHDVRVFAYEGAVSLSSSRQKAHGNALHGREAVDEHHPLTRDWITHLQTLANEKSGSLVWVNCGLCADERGIDQPVDGVSRGSPADFYTMLEHADNVLVIGTR